YAEVSQQEQTSNNNPKNSGAVDVIIPIFDNFEHAGGNEEDGPKAKDVADVQQAHISQQEHHAHRHKHQTGKKVMPGPLPPLQSPLETADELCSFPLPPVCIHTVLLLLM